MITIAYRWWGRVVVCRIVIGCAGVWWILHFTLHSHFSHWFKLRDTRWMDIFLVVSSYMRVLEYDTPVSRIHLAPPPSRQSTEA
jgi:hypothetical protein